MLHQGGYPSAGGGAVTAAQVTSDAVSPLNGTDLQTDKAAIAGSLYGIGVAIEALQTDAAPLASPALTGNPTAPTQTAGNNSTRLATTAYVDTADALKAPLASPTLTGTPAAPTAAVDTATTQIATTAFVVAQASASGDGTPAANGTAARGSSTHYARADHVHPTSAPALSAASVTNSADVLVSGSNTWTLMTWNTELDDPDGYHDTGSNTGRMTVPTGKGGRHLLLATLVVQAVPDSSRTVYARFYKNGSFLASGPVAHSSTPTLSGGSPYFGHTLTLQCVANLVAGDYIEVYFMANDSGANTGVMSGSDTSARAQFTVVKLT